MTRKSNVPPESGQTEKGNNLGEGLQEALGGLTQALGGVVGGLGKTVSGVTKGVTGTLQGVLGNLLGPLQQLKQQAQGGSEEAGQAYGQAVDMLQKSAGQGRADAQQLLKELGEELGQEPPGDQQKNAA